MKPLILAAATILGLAGAAQAANYDVFVTANPFRSPGAPGLQTRAVTLSPSGPQNFNGAGYSFSLANIGDTVSMWVYGLVSYDSPINADDLTPRPTSATFDFGAYGKRSITGESYAVANGPLPTTDGFALAEFFGQSVRFKVSPTEQLVVSLTDTVFGSTGGLTNFTDGRRGIGMVQANFSLSPVPLPAALPLGLAALGALGFVGRRRKTAAKSA
ncbi:MAG: hypothetical protein KDK26_06730 [Roseivivax sp.]|nr:hypothetical protein [Roseivivax sp.]